MQLLPPPEIEEKIMLATGYPSASQSFAQYRTAQAGGQANNAPHMHMLRAGGVASSTSGSGPDRISEHAFDEEEIEE